AADAVRDGVGMVAPVHVRHRQPVVEEAEMEFPFLQHAPEMPVIIRRPGIGARERVAPGAREIGAVLRLQEGDQGHLAHRSNPSIADAPGSGRATTKSAPMGPARALGCKPPADLPALWPAGHSALIPAKPPSKPLSP